MKTYNTHEEGRQAFAAHRALLAQRGIIVPGVQAYLPEPFKYDSALAMDALAMDAAQAGLQTIPNASIPAMLSTYIDPETIEILYSPTNISEALGESKKGDWTTDTAAFPVSQQTGEVSTYGDQNNNGRAGINMNWPSFQQYRYQTIISYGELEMERANLGKINYVNELQKAAATVMAQYANTVYAFGVAGLQNYGLLNNPYLSAPISPSTKVGGGTSWDNATANEIFDDIKALITRVIQQNGGNVNTKSKFTLVLSPDREALLAATNSFNVNVNDLIKKNYPTLRIVTAVQFATKSATNPQGNLAGNLMFCIADDVMGQKTGFGAFTEKLRAHPIVVEMSAWKQKRSAGTFGTIIRMPVAIAQMVGI